MYGAQPHIYTEAVETSIYEELPEDTPPPLNLNGASAVPATSLPPSIPPPRKTYPLNSTTQELSESEREAIEAKLGETGGAPDARSLASSCPGEETEDCYTVMSPAGTLTVLPHNHRHSAGGASQPAGPWQALCEPNSSFLNSAS